MQTMSTFEETRFSESNTKILSAEEIGRVVALLQELRDVTLSRGTFTAASDLLARLTGEPTISRLVPSES